MGMTCLPKEKVLLDLEYKVEHRSLALDVKIILKTPSVLGSGEGAR